MSLGEGEKLNIWCANIGWKWHDNWVYRLQRMVAEHCSVPYRFRCISDHDIPGVECVPFSREILSTKEHHSEIKNSPHMLMEPNRPQGCWAKVDAWKLAPLGSYNMILDLDISIIGDLADLVSEEPAGARDGRHKPDRPHLNGSVIAWKSTPETQAVYPKKIPYVAYPRGEQEYVQNALGGFIPMEGVLSYKMHMTGEQQKDPAAHGIKIVVFHGVPTPANGKLNQRFQWLRDSWEGIERIDRKP
jgi:hypothetical protein